MPYIYHKKKSRSISGILITAVLLLSAAVGGYLLLIQAPAVPENPGSAVGGFTTLAPTTTTTAPPPKPVFTAAKTAELDAQINARQAMVMDLDESRVLYARGEYDLCYPASLTKLLTAAVVLTYCEPGDVFKVGGEIHLAETDASSAYLLKGWELPVRVLLEGLLLPSGADASYTLAVNVARIAHPELELSDAEAVAAFCELMNEQAAALGCENTHFVNPDGYHSEDHYSTPADMALICRASLSYPAITAACALSKAEGTLAVGGREWSNSNPLIREESPWYYPAANGLKTGYTSEAGHCLAATAEEDGVRLLVLVFGCPASDLRSWDTVTLFEAGFSLLDDGHIPVAYAQPTLKSEE
ncbi:MAG: hypothetical protein FWE80_05895 [Oscillospiraceae bacterium]|nr:hypothetical protein [Oscillospiraceae bacterium]